MEEMKKGFCPLFKDECAAEECAWYSMGYESCSVLLLAETMQDATMEGGAFRTVIRTGGFND